MPYTITWEPGGVVKRHHGFLTGPELVEAAECVVGDLRYDRLTYIINDFTEVDGHSVDAAAVEDYASLRIGAAYVKRDILSPFVIAQEPGPTIVALLQSREYVNAHPLRVFPTLAEARRWVAAELAQRRVSVPR